MPFVFAACTALLGTFLYLKIPPSVPRPPGTGNTSPLIPREPTVDQLVERLAADHATEDQVVAAIRGKFAPDLREKATLLEALNHLRPSITQASHDDYQSFADAMKDEPMLAAVRSTLAGTSVDAFMDEETRPQVRDLDPDGFRTLAALLRDSPATNADSERPIYRELERTLMESSKAAQPRRPGDERRITGVFVYEDAKDRLPILLGLFERGGSGELTELGRILVDETQKRPATLADWLEAAAEAHESTGPHAHPWLSRQVLAMHRRQAADPRSRSPGAAKFYEHLDGFLRDCRAAVRTAAPTPPAANPAPPATGSSAQPAAQGGPREPEATSQPR